MKNRETDIMQDLSKRFPYLNDKIRIQRDRRVYIEVEYTNFIEVFEYAIRELGFTFLCTITGLDEGEKISLYTISRHRAGSS